MKNVLILFSCMSLMLLFSCQEEGVQEVVNHSSATSFNIPDSLAVYEMVNGERKRSTTIRLLTDSEKQKLVEKGAIRASDEVNLRLQSCEWADTGASIDCGYGTTVCKHVITDDGLDCLGCFNSSNDLGNWGPAEMIYKV